MTDSDDDHDFCSPSTTNNDGHDGDKLARKGFCGLHRINQIFNMASLRSSSLPKTIIRSLNPCRQRSLRYSTSHNHPPTHGRVHVQHGRIKGSHAFTVALSASCLAFTLGALYPPSIATLISPRPAPGPPDPSHPSSKDYVEDLEQQLQNLSLLEKVRASPDANAWYETRPYEHVPEEHRVNSLTAGTLRGPGKLALLPLLRAKTDETESITFMHFGRGLCGHDGIVHGGLIATILDESLGRQVCSAHIFGPITSPYLLLKKKLGD